ncbi:MAG: nucleotide sugar dehydrogenase, partial [Alphaproteobacteria bacterium]|nr:nucleotide sugar dehydrogenase [Alphaproteobacteria bacterium]
LTLRAWEDLPPADATIVAVAHRVFLECPLDELVRTVKPGGCFIDVQSRFDRAALEKKGLNVWRL